LKIEVLANSESVARRWLGIRFRGSSPAGEKAEMLNRLVDGDGIIPAGRVLSDRALRVAA